MPHMMLIVEPLGRAMPRCCRVLPRDAQVALAHRQLSGEGLILNVCAGWHAHLALLVARMEGRQPPSLWSTCKRLRKDDEGGAATVLEGSSLAT